MANRAERSVFKSFQSQDRWQNFESCSASRGRLQKKAALLKISHQLLIGFRFDVWRHSPWEGKTEALFLRELFSVSGSESPHQLPPSSPLSEARLFVILLI